MGLAKQILDATLSILRRPTPATRRAGRPGTAIFGGFIQTVEKNKKLNDRERYRTFSEILANVSIIGASVRYFLNVLARADWKVEPSDPDDPQAVEIAERIKRALFEELATPFQRVVRRTAMARYYGFSWQEWTARRSEDGVIVFDDIEPRPQMTIERWDLDLESGKVIGVIQRAPQDSREMYIPRSKSVYMVDDSLHDSPEGLGLFRHIVDSAERLIRFEQLEGFGFEKDLRGIPVGRVPIRELNAAIERGDISKEEAEKQIEAMREFIRMSAKEPQTGLLLDSITYQNEDEASAPSTVPQWALDLLSGDHAGLQEAAQAISRIQREVARVLGTEAIMLGETGAGSLAMSRDKTGQFAQIVDSTLSEIAEVYEKDVLDPLMMLNGWPAELRPSLMPDKIQQRDVIEIAESLAAMARAGANLQPNDPAVDAVRDLLGLPHAPMVEMEDDLQLDGEPVNQPGPGATDREMDRESTDETAEEIERRFVIEDGRPSFGVEKYDSRRESRFAVIGKDGDAHTVPQRARKAAEAQAHLTQGVLLAKKVGSSEGRSVYIPIALLAKVLIKPKKGESRKDFVSRFAGSDEARREFTDAKQRVAVANQIFRDRNKK